MKPNEPNQGEGDHHADEKYRDDVREFIAKGKVEAAANDARDFVERDPEAARRAERAGKRGPRTTVDDLIARGRTVVDRVKHAVDGLRDRISTRQPK